MATKKKVHSSDNSSDKNDSDDEEVNVEEEYDEWLDVDMNMDVDANPQETGEVLSLQVVDFDPGNAIGKLLAFINQLRGCSESAHTYFEELCVLCKLEP